MAKLINRTALRPVRPRPRPVETAAPKAVKPISRPRLNQLTARRPLRRRNQ